MLVLQRERVELGKQLNVLVPGVVHPVRQLDLVEVLEELLHEKLELFPLPDLLIRVLQLDNRRVPVQLVRVDVDNRDEFVNQVREIEMRVFVVSVDVNGFHLNHIYETGGKLKRLHNRFVTPVHEQEENLANRLLYLVYLETGLLIRELFEFGGALVQTDEQVLDFYR